MKYYCPTGGRNHGRPFWIRETGTGQQVTQLHERYMMMMDCLVLKFNASLFRTSAQGV